MNPYQNAVRRAKNRRVTFRGETNTGFVHEMNDMSYLSQRLSDAARGDDFWEPGSRSFAGQVALIRRVRRLCGELLMDARKIAVADAEDAAEVGADILGADTDEPYARDCAGGREEMAGEGDAGDRWAPIEAAEQALEKEVTR